MLKMKVLRFKVTQGYTTSHRISFVEKKLNHSIKIFYVESFVILCVTYVTFLNKSITVRV
jgi:hypothetical protein